METTAHDETAALQSLQAVLQQQRAAFAAARFPDIAIRRQWLTTLERVLVQHANEICAAINDDFGCRSATETRLLELFPALQGLRYARRRLASWMHFERRGLSKWLLAAQAEVRHQPLGVVGIVAPWNYPLYLTIAPLTDALAAGNRVMLKPSEHSPRFAALLAHLLSTHFPRDLVHTVVGGLDVARAFTRLPFDHLLFTGSTAVGREVMANAARNLTPVTLELGGKSPAIVGNRCNIEVVARRILFGKLSNAGQTCVAPDYVLAPEPKLVTLLAYLRMTAQEWYARHLHGYTSIAHEAHHARLLELLEDARQQGARIEPLLDIEVFPHPRHLAPSAVLDADANMRLMQEEIFGPILPLLPYRSLEEAVAFVNARERPLALYLFEDDRRRREYVLANTASGGATINDTLLHAGQPELPFGGVGASGMGRYHGYAGFEAFSQVRAVLHQRRISTVPLLYPPHGSRARTLLRWMLRE